MLVLSRKIGEQVLIPQLNITVTVLSVGTNRVQLGIKAPREIDITRPDAVGPRDRKQTRGSTRVVTGKRVVTFSQEPREFDGYTATDAFQEEFAIA